MAYHDKKLNMSINEIDPKGANPRKVSVHTSPPTRGAKRRSTPEKTGIEKEVEENKGGKKNLGEIRGCIEKIRRNTKF